LEVKTDTLTLPHPEASKRRFVLEPLSEIAPDIVFPGFGMTIMQMLGELPSGDATVEINPFKFPETD
jgi:2-amino-4-hydroxy-6-hydroxymethyldihydropteridine diphosphokinase